MENYTEINAEEYENWLTSNYSELIDDEIVDFQNKCIEKGLICVKDDALPF